MPKNAKAKSSPRKVAKPAAVWAGPQDPSPRGGITYSLLTRFLTCPERFRCLVVDGLKPQEHFNARIEYGNLWHAAEECGASWEAGVRSYTTDLAHRYPTDVDAINQWTQMCLTQYRVYLDYWAQHKDADRTTPLLAEQVFHVPYRLPSGRTVYLRGKWDGVVHVESGPNKGVWLREHKTKSRIDPIKMQRNLTFDLQTMLYLVALSAAGYEWLIDTNSLPLRGVRYNVVRRSEHRVGKKETLTDFCGRVGQQMQEEPGEWFMRWDVAIRPYDLEQFRKTCLDPLLERLCTWYAIVVHPKVVTAVELDSLVSLIHWRHPFGSVNWVDEADGTDLDEYLATGSTIGLRKVHTLFPELEVESAG